MISKEDFSKYIPTDWYVEHTPARPLMVSGIVRGFVDGLKLQDYQIVLCYYRQGEIDWITLIKDQDKIGELIFKKHEKDKNYWSQELHSWLKIKKQIEQTFDKFRKNDLSQLSAEELLDDIETYTNLQWQARKISSLTDPFMFYSEKQLMKLLDKFSCQNPDFNAEKAIEIITRVEDPLFLNEVELDLVNIAKDIKAGDNIQDQKIQQKIKNHLDKFCWLKVESFSHINRYSLQQVEENLAEILKFDLEQKEKENKLWQENKKIRQDYLGQYNFDKRVVSIAQLSPLFAKWADLRKENSVRITYLHSLYVQELSKKLKMEEDDLAYLDYVEIKDLIKGDLDKSLLKKRKQGSLFVFKGHEFKVFYQQEIKDIIDKIIHPHTGEVREFFGMVACSGQAQGPVKIVVSQKDNVKIEKGDILVAAMTRPEHMPAMKKAAAIITNEGGLTCHAAIVSRELKIPCIVGTKIATKVLREGDRVRVNADKGLIEKL